MTDREWDKEEAREYWKHEDNLINHRLQWFGVIQGLLFAAYALSFRTSQAKEEIMQAKFEAFIVAIPWAGLLTSIVVFMGLLAAFFAMQTIKKESKMKRLGVSRRTTIFGFLSALFLPVIIGFTWAYLLVA